MNNEEAYNFALWMAKMKNVHYSDDSQMEKAFDRVTPLKYREL